MTRKELIEQHIKTHTVTEEMDKQAVSFLILLFIGIHGGLKLVTL